MQNLTDKRGQHDLQYLELEIDNSLIVQMNCWAWHFLNWKYLLQLFNFTEEINICRDDSYRNGETFMSFIYRKNEGEAHQILSAQTPVAFGREKAKEKAVIWIFSEPKQVKGKWEVLWLTAKLKCLWTELSYCIQARKYRHCWFSKVLKISDLIWILVYNWIDFREQSCTANMW